MLKFITLTVLSCSKIAVLNLDEHCSWYKPYSIFWFWAYSYPLGLFKGTSFRNWGQTHFLNTRAYRNCEFPINSGLHVMQSHIISSLFCFIDLFIIQSFMYNTWVLLACVRAYTLHSVKRNAFVIPMSRHNDQTLSDKYNKQVSQQQSWYVKYCWECWQKLFFRSANEHIHPWFMLFINLAQCHWLCGRRIVWSSARNPFGCFILSAFSHCSEGLTGLTISEICMNKHPDNLPCL